MKRTLYPIAAALLSTPLALSVVEGAALDLSLDYRVRALSYSNISMDPAHKGSDDFISERARVGFMVKKIQLETLDGVEESMEVGLVMQALNVAGSTVALPAPFSRAESRYPATRYSPFVENAYLKVFHALGTSWDATVGRQPFMLGSGLVVADDGTGFTGISIKRPLQGPWGAQAFYFQPRALGTNGTDRLHLAGAALDLQLDGVLTLSEVVEADHTGGTDGGVALESATRHFPGVRYAVKTDKFAFEGEGVVQRGSAKPAAGGTKLKYRGGAGQVTALWKQDLGRFGTGVGRLSVGEATGDNTGSPNRVEGFQPSFGHRFDGLERDGWGDLYGASLYDAIGPSTTTANGLPAGVSGMRIVRLGMTLPEWRRIKTDLDFFLFRAAQAPSSKKLGSEIDLKFTYAVKDRLLMRASYATFKPGAAVGATHVNASRVGFEISGKF